MKQYVIDELRPQDYQKIKQYLSDCYGASGVEGIYWIPVPNELLTTIQQQHSACQPFYVVIDLERHMLSCELLVRTQSKVRCECISYATESQRNWLISFIDDMLTQLHLIT
ncbi:MAG: hypothetical protein HQK77_01985 [Desulfobacterales bacterium]|nr:hypothetical protein [Desulfobacterales bacterium]